MAKKKLKNTPKPKEFLKLDIHGLRIEQELTDGVLQDAMYADLSMTDDQNVTSKVEVALPVKSTFDFKVKKPDFRRGTPKHLGLLNTLNTLEFYQKNLIFTISNQREKEEIKEIFDQTGAETLLTFKLSGKNYFIEDPDKKVPHISYGFTHKTISGNPMLPSDDNKDKETHLSILSYVEQMALKGLLRDYMYERLTGNFTMTERSTLSNLCVNALLDKEMKPENASYRKEIMRILFQDSLHGKTSYETLASKMREKNPISAIYDAIQSGDIMFAAQLRKIFIGTKNSLPAYIDYSATDPESLKSIQKQSKVVVYGLKVDDEEVSLATKENMEKISKDKQDVFILASMKKLYGNGFLTNVSRLVYNSIGTATIKRGDNSQKLLSSKIANGTLFYEYEDENALRKDLEEWMLKKESAIPAKINNKFFLVRREESVSGSHHSIPTTSLERSKIKDRIDMIMNALKNDDFFETSSLITQNALTLSQTHLRPETLLGTYLSASSNIEQKALYSFTSTHANKNHHLKAHIDQNISSEMSLLPDIQSIENILTSTSSKEALHLFSSVTFTARVLPSINKVGGKNVSIKDVLSSPFATSYFLQFKQLASLIKEIANKEGYALPAMLPREFSLTAPSKNKLPEIAKDVRINPHKNEGILDLKILPLVIDIKEQEAKKIFFGLAKEAILSAFHKENRESLQSANIDKPLHDNYEKAIQGAAYAVVKMEDEIQKYTFKTEKLVLLDDEYNEISVTNIPVFNFYEAMKQEGLIKKEDTVKPVKFTRGTVDAVFNGITEMVNHDIVLNQDLFKDIKRIFGSFIKKENESRANESKSFLSSLDFSKNNTAKLYSRIKESGITKHLESRMRIVPATPKNIMNIIFKDFDKNDKRTIATKKNLETLLENIYTGKEFSIAFSNPDPEKFTSLLKKHFMLFPEDTQTQLASNLQETLQAESEKDITILKSIAKMFTIYSFASYIAILQEKQEISLKEKNSLISVFLAKVFQLSPHQLLEVKGMLALHLSGEKNKEDLWYEMRGGKTRIVHALSLLKSVISKEESMFFVQNKNFDDIVGQAFDMYPPMALNHTNLLGSQKRLIADKSPIPIGTTEWIFLNIPVALKTTGLLRNPDKSSDLAPASYLAANYLQTLEKITAMSQDITPKRMEEIYKKNAEYLADPGVIYENMPNTETAQELGKMFYFYIISIMKEEFLPSQKNVPEVETVLKEKFGAFWSKYSDALGQYKQKNGEVTIIGKQFISSFAAATQTENNIKTKTLIPRIKTEFDIEAVLPENRLLSTQVFHENLFNFTQALDIKPQWQKESLAVLPTMRQKTKDHKNIRNYILKRSSEATADHLIQEFLNEVFETIQDNDVTDIVQNNAQLLRKNLSTLLFRYLENGPKHAKGGHLDYLYLRSDKVPAHIFDMNDFSKKFKNRIAIPEIANSSYAEDIKRLLGGTLFNASKLATKISSEAYKKVVSIIYDPGHNSARLKSRLSVFLPENANMTKHDVEIMLHFTKEVENVLLPTTITKEEQEKSLRKTAHTNLFAKVQDKKDPSESRKSPIFIRDAKIVFSKTKGTFLELDQLASHIKDEVVEYKDRRKKYNKNLSSSILWDIDASKNNRKIGSVAIDEIHKNTSGGTSLNTKSLLHKIIDDNKESNPLTITPTGTPFRHLRGYASLLSMFTSNIKNLEREIIKECGNFKVRSAFISFLIVYGHKSDIASEHLNTGIKNALEGRFNGLGTASTYHDAIKLYDLSRKEKEFDTLYVNFMEKEKIHETRDKSITDIDKMLTDASASILTETRKDIKALYPDLDHEEREHLVWRAFYDINYTAKDMIIALIKSNSYLVSQEAGFSNPLGMANLTHYVPDSNISLRRSSEDIEYQILDSNKTQNIHPSDVSAATLATLLRHKMLKKYRTTFSIDSIFNYFYNLSQIALSGLREHSKDILNIDTIDFNALVNRSQDSVEDGFMDEIRRMLKHNSPMPEKFKDVFDHITTSIAFMEDAQAIENTKKQLLRSDEQSIMVEFIQGKEIEIERKLITSTPSTIMIDGKRAFSKNDSKANKQRGDLVFSITKQGAMIETHYEKNKNIDGFLLPMYANTTVKPFKDLPSISFAANVSFDDDASIFEALAFSNEVSDVMGSHINQNHNIRIMTTRTKITELAILECLNAIIHSENKDMIHNVLVNATGEEIGNFVEKILQDQHTRKVLERNNIKLITFDTNSLESLQKEILSKNHNLHIIGNYISLAEGVNMDFIDYGFYRGALLDSGATIQSFARQIGFNQNKSRFYLYGDNFLMNASARISSLYNYSHLHAAVTSNQTIDFENFSADDFKHDYMNIFNLSTIELFNDTYTSLHNKKREMDFKGYETIMTGKGPVVKHEALTTSDLQQNVNSILAPAYMDPLYEQENKSGQESHPSMTAKVAIR